MLKLTRLTGTVDILLYGPLPQRRYAESPAWKGDLNGASVLVTWDHSIQEFACKWDGVETYVHGRDFGYSSQSQQDARRFVLTDEICSFIGDWLVNEKERKQAMASIVGQRKVAPDTPVSIAVAAEQREYGRHAAWVMGASRQNEPSAVNPWKGRDENCDYLREAWEAGQAGRPYEPVSDGDEPTSTITP